MLCVCVGDVTDVVFSVCIVRCGAVGARVTCVTYLLLVVFRQHLIGSQILTWCPPL